MYVLTLIFPWLKLALERLNTPRPGFHSSGENPHLKKTGDFSLLNLDAITLLILLDIEDPRLKGYEVQCAIHTKEFLIMCDFLQT